MHIIYLILYLLLSPILAFPLLFVFTFIPIVILGLPGLLWRACKRMLFPAAVSAPISTIIPTIPPIKRKPYRPKGKRSKMAGIRRNRAVLNIAKGGATNTPTSTIVD